MRNLLITFDDPMERLLYGEPDPWLELFECRHETGYQHHHKDVNPPAGPGDPGEIDPPDVANPPTEPDPPNREQEWRRRYEAGEPSQSPEETAWRTQQATQPDNGQPEGSAGDGSSGDAGNGHASDQNDGAPDGQLPPPYTDEEREAMIALGWTPGAPHEEYLERVRTAPDDGPGQDAGQPRGRAARQGDGSGDKSAASGAPAGGSAGPRHEGTHPEPDNPPHEVGDVVDPPGGGILYEVVIDNVVWDAANNQWEVSGINRRKDGNPGGGTRVTWQVPGPIHDGGGNGNGGNGNGGTPTYTDYTVAPPGFTQEEWDTLPGSSQRGYYLSGGNEFWTNVLHFQVDYEAQQDRQMLLEEGQQQIEEARGTGDDEDVTEAFLSVTNAALAAQDIVLLQWLAEQEEAGSILVSAGESGESESLRTYLEGVFEYYDAAERTRSVLAEIDGITSRVDAGDVAALQAIAQDPEKADLPITVNGVETTVGEHLANVVIPQTQASIYTGEGEITEDNGAHAWNQSLPGINNALETLNDPDATAEDKDGAVDYLAELGIKFEGSGWGAFDHDKDPSTPPVDASTYLNELYVYGVGRAADAADQQAGLAATAEVADITATPDPGDAAALQAIIDDPDNAGHLAYTRDADGNVVVYHHDHDGDPETDPVPMTVGEWAQLELERIAARGLIDRWNNLPGDDDPEARMAALAALVRDAVAEAERLRGSSDPTGPDRARRFADLERHFRQAHRDYIEYRRAVAAQGASPDAAGGTDPAAGDQTPPPAVGDVLTLEQAKAFGDPNLAGRTVTQVDENGTIWTVNMPAGAPAPGTSGQTGPIQPAGPTGPPPSPMAIGGPFWRPPDGIGEITTASEAAEGFLSSTDVGGPGWRVVPSGDGEAVIFDPTGWAWGTVLRDDAGGIIIRRGSGRGNFAIAQSVIQYDQSGQLRSYQDTRHEGAPPDPFVGQVSPETLRLAGAPANPFTSAPAQTMPSPDGAAPALPPPETAPAVATAGTQPPGPAGAPAPGTSGQANPTQPAGPTGPPPSPMAIGGPFWRPPDGIGEITTASEAAEGFLSSTDVGGPGWRVVPSGDGEAVIFDPTGWAWGTVLRDDAGGIIIRRGSGRGNFAIAQSVIQYDQSGQLLSYQDTRHEGAPPDPFVGQVSPETLRLAGAPANPFTSAPAQTMPSPDGAAPALPPPETAPAVATAGTQPPGPAGATIYDAGTQPGSIRLTHAPPPPAVDSNGNSVPQDYMVVTGTDGRGNDVAIPVAAGSTWAGRSVDETTDPLIAEALWNLQRYGKIRYNTSTLLRLERLTPEGTPEWNLIQQEKQRISERQDRADERGGGGGGSRQYTVNDDGSVQYTEDGHTYTVTDEDLKQDVQTAVATGDTTGLSGVADNVTVADESGNLVATPAGPLQQQADAPPTVGVNIAAIPAGNINPGLAAAIGAPELAGHTVVEGTVGDNFTADVQRLIDLQDPEKVPDDPAMAAIYLDGVAEYADSLADKWGVIDAQGWTFQDKDGNPVTAAQFFTGQGSSIAVVADQNRDIGANNAASQQAIDDFNTDLTQAGDLSPAEANRLAEEWRNRPDNDLVRIPIRDEDGEIYQYQTPAQYFARMATDPVALQRERDTAVMPGETPTSFGGGVGIDPVTGQPQVAPGVFTNIADAREANREHRRFVYDYGTQNGLWDADNPPDFETAAGLVNADIQSNNREYRTSIYDYGIQNGLWDPDNPPDIEAAAGLVTAHIDGKNQEYRTSVYDYGIQNGLWDPDNPPDIEAAAGLVTAHIDGKNQEYRTSVYDYGIQNSLWDPDNPPDPQTAAALVNAHITDANQSVEQQKAQPGADLGVIAGDLSEPVTPEAVGVALGAMAQTTVDAQEGQRDRNQPTVNAQQQRFDRIASGNTYDIDSIKAAFPELSHEEANQQLALQVVMDTFQATDAIPGSVELQSQLVGRGLSPEEAARTVAWVQTQGLTTYSDLVATGAALVGGGIAGRVATRFIPVFRTRINPRLTTGMLRSGTEETGEELAEFLGDIGYVTATGGNPLSVITNPDTYVQAGGSIFLFGIGGADRPSGSSSFTPNPRAVPDGQPGQGAVYSLDGSPVDPALAAQGNRLLDRWAAAKIAYNNTPADPPPGTSQSDTAMHYRRKAALERDVENSGNALTGFREANTNLVVGYKSGGSGLSVVAADNSILTVGADGDVTVHVIPPGEGQFVPGGSDARSIGAPGLTGPDNSGDSGANATVGPGAVGSPVSSAPINAGRVDGLPGTSNVVDSTTTATATPTPDPSVAPSPTVQSAPQVEPAPAVQAQPQLAPQPQASATPTVSPAPTLAPIPTATLQPEPLPFGQAVPSAQQQAAPTLTSVQPASPGGRAAPPSVIDPGAPTPGRPTPPSPSPAQQPQPQPGTTPQITPTPNPDPFGDPSPEGGPTPFGEPTPTTFPQPTPFGQPAVGTQPSVTTIPEITPSPFPDTSPHPEPEPSPEPGVNPTPEPATANEPTQTPTPTITITTTETPTPTPRQKPRDDPDRKKPKGRRRIEIPNPVADDPNRHPREVQFVEPLRHTVDLVTGEHTIEPLTDQQLRTARITAFGPEDPEGNVHRAGSLVIEPERRVVLLESATRRRDANIVPGEEAAFSRPVGLRPGALPAPPGGRPLRPREGVFGQTSDGPRLRPREGAFSAPSGAPRLRPREGAFSAGSGAPKLRLKEGALKAPSGGSKPKALKKDPAATRGATRLKPKEGVFDRRRTPDPYAGLVGGGGGARRGGGGRRRRDEEEDERRNGPPQITVVVQ